MCLAGRGRFAVPREGPRVLVRRWQQPLARRSTRHHPADTARHGPPCVRTSPALSRPRYAPGLCTDRLDVPAARVFLKDLLRRHRPVRGGKVLIAVRAAFLVGIDHLALDGKPLRGSARARRRPRHVVRAWATPAHRTRGQRAVDTKSSEITALAPLLALLDLPGALVTLDARGCPKGIAPKIGDGFGADVLAVNGNQEHLREDFQAPLEPALPGKGAAAGSSCSTRRQNKATAGTSSAAGWSSITVRACVTARDGRKCPPWAGAAATARWQARPVVRCLP